MARADGRDGADPATAAAVDAVRRIVRLLRQAARQTETRAGLSAAQLFVLSALAETPAASLTELARRTLTDRTSAAAVVARLEARGLVRRTPSAEDRRRSTVAITAAGRTVLKRAPEPPTARLIAGLRALPPARRRQLADALVELTERLGIAHGPSVMLFEDDAGSAPPAARERAPASRRTRQAGGRPRT